MLAPWRAGVDLTVVLCVPGGAHFLKAGEAGRRTYDQLDTLNGPNSLPLNLSRYVRIYHRAAFGKGTNHLTQEGEATTLPL